MPNFWLHEAPTLSEEIDAKRACEELIVRYTHIADFGPGKEMAELFTADGVWKSHEATYDGRDEIDAFFSSRDGEPGKSRHVCTNIHVRVTGVATAEALSYFTIYHYPEEKPRVPDLEQQPVILGEYRDNFRLTEHGWKISHRQVDISFARRPAR